MNKPVIGVSPSFDDKAHLEKQSVNPFYIHAIELAGGQARVLNMLTPPEEIPALLGELDGVLLSGGGDYDPATYGCEREAECGESCAERDLFELELTRQAVLAGVPVLGICRGAQTINVAMGGTLYQHIPSVTGVIHQQKEGCVYWHDVDILPGTQMHSLLGRERLAVNSYHHQAAFRLGRTLRAGAMSRDGLIESIESMPGESWLFGLQWHPERTVGKDASSLRFFEELVRRAVERSCAR